MACFALQLERKSCVDRMLFSLFDKIPSKLTYLTKLPTLQKSLGNNVVPMRVMKYT